MFAFPAGSVTVRDGLGEIAALLQVPLNATLLNQVVSMAEVAWQSVTRSVQKRQASAVETMLSQLVPDGDSMVALMDPVAGPALIRGLPDLVDARELRGIGLDARTAKAMLSDVALRPLAAAWKDLVQPIRVWEVVSQLADLIVPIWTTAGGVQVRGVDHVPAARWSLRLPRSSHADHAAVAVRLAPLIASGQANEPRARAIVQACWDQVLGQYPGAVGTITGDLGLAAFASPARAIQFASSIHASLPGAQGIVSHPEVDGSMAVSPDLRVGVGLAWGRVDGGTDGAGVWLEGPAIGAAIALTGQGAPSLRRNDPLHIRSVTGQEDGLRSDGITADAAFVQESLRTLTHPVHVNGTSDEVAGISQDFRFYPVPYWWEEDNRVWMWLELGGRLADGPAELAVLNRVMFRDIHSRDSALERSDIGEPAERPSTQQPGQKQVAEPLGSDVPDWNPFDALSRTDTAIPGAEDPWAQLGEQPEVVIDDD